MLKNNNALISEKDMPEFIGRGDNFVKRLMREGKITPVGVEEDQKFFYRDQVRYAAYSTR